MRWLIFGIVIGFSIGFFFSSIDLDFTKSPERVEWVVTKITDGDTIVAGGENVRLLGMDTDEKGYPCYLAAKKRLEELVLNKRVILESGPENRGQYGRLLRYIILDGENINLRMVSEGYAVARFFPPNKKYREEILEAENSAIEAEIGCKWQR